MLNQLLIIKEESSMIPVLQKNKTMLFQLLDSDSMKKPNKNIGLLEIHGENIGEKWDSSEFF